MLLNSRDINNIINVMEQLYPDAGCELDFDSIFELLISVVLSAQTTDKSVNKISPALFKLYPDAFSLAKADQSTLENMLRSIGMYKTKARHLIALSRILVKEHKGQVPQEYDQLIKLPGVGRKTANVVLSVGFGQQCIAVDTHVYRLANRIGFTEEKDVLSTELKLMKRIPRGKWIRLHHLLIWHGRRVCSARNPKCISCGIEGLCKKKGL